MTAKEANGESFKMLVFVGISSKDWTENVMKQNKGNEHIFNTFFFFFCKIYDITLTKTVQLALLSERSIWKKNSKGFEESHFYN